MKNRNSYLDTVNAGRTRRQSVDLQAISSTLSGLEAELERLSLNRASRTNPAPAPRPAPSAPPPRTRIDAPAGFAIAESAAHTALLDRIAREIEGLKGEVRTVRTHPVEQDVAELKAQLAGLQQAMERNYVAPLNYSGEFDRLHDRLDRIPADAGASHLGGLREEMEDLRHAVAVLARDESVRAVEERWNQFDNRWSAFENTVVHKLDQPRDSSELLELADRIYNLQELVATLPETLPIGSLEKQIGTLARAIERVAANDGTDVAGALTALEERLDELSRAIVAISVSAQPPVTYDFSSIDRIESRINTIARKFEDGRDNANQAELLQRIEMLGQRIDQALEADLDSDALLRAFDDRLQVLHRRIEELSVLAADTGAHTDLNTEIVARLRDIETRLETRTQPQTDDSAIVRHIEKRLDALSLQIGDKSANGHNDEMMQLLQNRLADITARLDSVSALEPDPATPAYLSSIERRIGEIAEKLHDAPQALPAAAGISTDTIEARLAEITARLDSVVRDPQPRDVATLANLESQIANISMHMGTLGNQDIREDLESRLRSIEDSIAASHDNIFEVARAAAERALSALPHGSEAAPGLSDDLKAIESFARKSDERNSKTFGAIHDTLLKIVERIGALEGTGTVSLPTPATKPTEARTRMPERNVPALDPIADPDFDEPLPPLGEQSFGPASRAATRSAVEAAAAAAQAAVARKAVKPQPAAKDKTSVAAGLARVLGRKKDEVAPPLPAPELPRAEFAMPKVPEVEADTEPKPTAGSQEPDLNAIMRRVREERNTGKPAAPDESGKHEFLIAARRHAKAAAAEAELLSREEKNKPQKGGAKLDAKAFLAKRKKPLTMAAYAILLAAAGLGLTKIYFSGEDQPAAKTAIDSSTGAAEVAAPAETNANAAAAPEAPAADGKPVRVIGSQPEADVESSTNEVDGDATAASIDRQASAGAGVSAGNDPAAQDAPVMDAAEPVSPATGPSASATPGAADAPEMAAGEQTGSADAMATVEPEAGPTALREAAITGNPAAMFEIASRYADGRNKVQNLAKSYDWYKKSADAGFAPAQYRIGSMLEKGNGITRDIRQAKTWYQMAAAQGNASAMHNLAVLFAMGADGAPDYDSAVKWFEQAAELGVKDSQYNLGILAAKGQGMAVNLEESYKWFALAAKAGDKEAARQRDEVFKVLRPEQQEKARATTELWKPKPLDDKANNVDVPEEWRESKESTASISKVDMTKAVRNVQGILNNNGFDAGRPDGLMGQKTVKAIKDFQKANGLPETGEIDQALVKALLAKNAAAKKVN